MAECLTLDLIQRLEPHLIPKYSDSVRHEFNTDHSEIPLTVTIILSIVFLLLLHPMTSLCHLAFNSRVPI